MNQIDIREARIRFSDKLAAKIIPISPVLGGAMALARAEWSTVKGEQGYVPCEHCPYASKSHHEASLHARFHRLIINYKAN